MTLVQADLDQPILFRTTSKSVYENTLATGELWLRTDHFYRNIEDAARKDSLEGVSSGTTSLRLNFPELQIFGDGTVGQQLNPHYIISLHGSSISDEIRTSFGGYTFGIKNLFQLSIDVLHASMQQVTCIGYRYGPIGYRRSAFQVSTRSNGGAAIAMGSDPVKYLNPIELDPLQKPPIEPFIRQDEWRIAIFVQNYLQLDSALPLKLKVPPSNFYPYG